ncbi:hypothetical protein HDU97_008017 [Phlyctochytrium planicorne]|nr:hypothetical protein HDU97_008017 [Phlyctochytrium planicorne]
MEDDEEEAVTAKQQGGSTRKLDIVRCILLIVSILGLGYVLELDAYFGDISQGWKGHIQENSPMELLDTVSDGSTADQPLMVELNSNNATADSTSTDGRIVSQSFLKVLEWMSSTSKSPIADGSDDYERQADRFVRVDGFKLCPMLNNATFDAMVPTSYWNGSSIAELENPQNDTITMIDDVALKITLEIRSKSLFLDGKDLIRYACYSAADGANSVAKLTKSRLLNTIDPSNYFGSVLPFLDSNQLPSLADGKKRKRKRFYKLAYLIMVENDDTVIPNIKHLVDELDDGSAIIMIHIDVNAHDLYEEIRMFIQTRNERIRRNLPRESQDENGNVYLASRRYPHIKRHVSLLWIQLNSYWELLDLAFWEHVVNLSSFDLPLRKSRELARIMANPDFRGFSYVSFWDDFDKVALRLTRPHLARTDVKKDKMVNYHPRETGMSQDALLSLAFIEHSLKPDETYFCYVIINTPYLLERTQSDSKRYARKEHLGRHELNELGWPTSSDNFVASEYNYPRYLFVSNVDVRTPQGYEMWMWLQRNHVMRYLRNLEFYGTLAERQPLLYGGPSTLVDAVQGTQTRRGRFPKAISGVPVDPTILESFRHANLVWKLIAVFFHILLTLPGTLFLLTYIRPQWDSIPDHLLFGTSKETCRFILLFSVWLGMLASFLGWRSLRPPFLDATHTHQTTTSPRLPLSPWQWAALRKSLMMEKEEEDGDEKVYLEKALEKAAWWADHPVSLSQRSEYAVRVWILGTAVVSFWTQALLIAGFWFAIHDIPVWPNALIPLSLLVATPLLSYGTLALLDLHLFQNPIEDRGIQEGILVEGLDVAAEVILRDKKRFDPFEVFPEPVAYILGDVLSFFLVI